MKSPLFIIQLLISIVANGQSSNDSKVDQMLRYSKDLTIVSELADSIFQAHFYRSFGLHGSGYQLKENKTFDFIRGQTFSQKGNWKLDRKKRLLILSSGKNRLSYYVVRFDKYYYLVPPNQVEAFVDKLYFMEQKYKGAEPIVVDNRIFSAVDQVAIQLANGYYWINWL